VPKVLAALAHLPCLHLAMSEMWCWPGGRGIPTELTPCCSIVYYYNCAQWYEQFLQVGRLDHALILLGLALCLPSASVSSVFVMLYIFNKIFFLYPSLYLLVSWTWWDWPSMCLTNHRPLVLWQCFLGHVNCKIVSKMTYNVSSKTLYPSISILYQQLLKTV